MANYYVDKTHANRNDNWLKSQNSEAAPWATIQRGVKGAPGGVNTNADQAITAGDTLYVKGNGQTYTEIYGLAPDVTRPALNPVNQGSSASVPIRIRAYPNHTITLTTDNLWPAVGAFFRNHIIWEGFILPIYAVYTNSLGGEMGYCEVLGRVSEHDGDNNIGLRTNDANGLRVHHNIFRDRTSPTNAANAAGIQMYDSFNLIIEDNWIRNCSSGVFDKRVGLNNHVRRNYFTQIAGGDFQGNEHASDAPGTAHVYNNVIDLGTNLRQANDGTTIHDNLYLDTYGLSGTSRTSMPVPLVDTEVYNNVLRFANGATLRPWYQGYPRTGNEIAYFNHNHYASNIPPTYFFQGTAEYSLAQFRSLGFEQQSTVIALSSFSNIYDATWNLKAPYTTAGRFGNGVGPRDANNNSIVATILNTARYGPAALDSGEPPPPPPPPPPPTSNRSMMAAHRRRMVLCT